ncbi:hypothetical protein K431DRAFT_256662 [Polychaeton citri CBS 116435]|uniref:Zn(2)-C6 fungal-type domain-containing protein n=1 Tax=Polychaeton citri CBS 116435 TaxID=1314669 RepID=A0A9P4Q1Y1_9PEZI|nr:hypothetical protein K431DRAFT_256662 [Polychaeton citri CBS 116435]
MWISVQSVQNRASKNYSIYSETGERRRRIHPKSKYGCVRCRQRRIKCDETKPSCSNCTNRGQRCQYGTFREPATAVNPGTDCPLLEPSMVAHLEAALACSRGSNPDLVDFADMIRLHGLESLNHFILCSQKWLKTPSVQQIMQRQAVGSIIHYPYLLHAVLAISTAHLAALDTTHTQSYSLTSRVCWQYSLRSYSECFIKDIETSSVDAIYFANILHSMLAFMYVQLPLPQAGATTMMPNWLTTLRGTHILLDMPPVVNRLRQGVWKPMIERHDRWHVEAQGRVKIASQLAPTPAILALRTYCNTLPQKSAGEREERLQFLTMLEQCSASAETVNASASFITEAPPEYISRIKRGDECALLLLSYWCKLFSKAGQWWLKQPAIAEAHRVRAYLQQTGDSSTQALLAIVHG